MKNEDNCFDEKENSMQKVRDGVYRTVVASGDTGIKFTFSKTVHISYF